MRQVFDSNRPASRRILLGIICTIGGGNPANSNVRTGAGAGPASEQLARKGSSEW